MKPGAKRRPIADRFWPRVDKSAECWIWTGAKLYRRGYGMIWSGGKRGKHIYTHRLSWELANGPIPKGMSVLHRCDNRPCCRPDHLFLGTQADNVADCVAKGRHASLQADWLAKARSRPPILVGPKLTAADVYEIKLIGDRLTPAELGRQYKVHEETIRKIFRGEKWKHVSLEKPPL